MKWNQFIAGCFIFVIVMAVVLSIIGEMTACYTIIDFTADLFRGGNVTMGCN